MAVVGVDSVHTQPLINALMLGAIVNILVTMLPRKTWWRKETERVLEGVRQTWWEVMVDWIISFTTQGQTMSWQAHGRLNSDHFHDLRYELILHKLCSHIKARQ